MDGCWNGRRRGALDRREFLRGLGGAGLVTAAAAHVGWAQGKPAAIVVAIQGGDDAGQLFRGLRRAAGGRFSLPTRSATALAIAFS